MTSDDSVTSGGEPEKAVGLERTVGLLGGVALIAGTMIGMSKLKIFPFILVFFLIKFILLLFTLPFL